MNPRRRAISLAGISLPFALPAFGQDIQERTIRFGHLNNADHPVSFGVKQPGPKVTIEGVEMRFDYKDYFEVAPSTGYETLIFDCMIGDTTLFKRAEEIEAGWRIVQPLLDLWSHGKADPPAPLSIYGRSKAAAEPAVLDVPRGVVVRDSRRDAARVIGVCLDITDRKAGEMRLVAQHAVARALAETHPVAEAMSGVLQAGCRLGERAGLFQHAGRQGVEPLPHMAGGIVVGNGRLCQAFQFVELYVGKF